MALFPIGASRNAQFGSDDVSEIAWRAESPFDTEEWCNVFRLVVGILIVFLDEHTLFFDENSEMGTEFPYFSHDIRNILASADTVEVSCVSVKVLRYCTHLRVLGRLENEHFCDGHALITKSHGKETTTSINARSLRFRGDGETPTAENV